MSFKRKKSPAEAGREPVASLKTYKQIKRKNEKFSLWTETKIIQGGPLTGYKHCFTHVSQAEAALVLKCGDFEWSSARLVLTVQGNEGSRVRAKNDTWNSLKTSLTDPWTEDCSESAILHVYLFTSCLPIILRDPLSPEPLGSEVYL